MQVNLTEDDLRAIWRDLYTEAARKGSGHEFASEHADHYVNALRADRKAIDDVFAAEAAARPPADQARTAEDERRDVLAYLRAKLASYATTFRSMPEDLGWPRDSLAAQVTLLDAVLIGEVDRGDHVGAADRAEVKP